MGLSILESNFLHYLQVSLGDTLTMGRQKLDIKGKNGYCEDFLKLHFHSTIVESLDASRYENVTHVIDLGIALLTDNPLHEKYDSVIDFGTLEHVFNPLIALNNMNSFLKPGGRIFHSVPADGSCGHGFFQFSPEFFYSYYGDVNSYSHLKMYLVDIKKPQIFWGVSKPKPGSRINVRYHKSTLYLLVSVTKIASGHGIENAHQIDYVERWRELPRQIFKDSILKSSCPKWVLNYLRYLKVSEIGRRERNNCRLNEKNPNLTKLVI